MQIAQLMQLAHVKQIVQICTSMQVFQHYLVYNMEPLPLQIAQLAQLVHGKLIVQLHNSCNAYNFHKLHCKHRRSPVLSMDYI